MPTVTPGWHASLALRFADTSGVTRLVARTHRGPLRVQKALYPEGPAVCHAIVLHPPGGVAGGDVLEIDVAAGPAAHVVLSTPGAAKWYRANGKPARQTVRLTVDAGASIEWLPQESIFFDGADASSTLRVDLGAGARFIGCDIVCLGRRAAGECFASGAIGQRTDIWQGEQLIWCEQGRLAAAGGAMHSLAGMQGKVVCATMLAAGAALTPAALAAVRAALPQLAFSQRKAVLVARWLGQDSETARRLMLAAWTLLRPELLGRSAPPLRIWHT